ncbi:MAG: thiamine pyrophosphate-binding protein [Pseudomonadota bacterium]|nr:thiamine pyrophosphate-binding protein [Pseudomonadota bacterium]
MELSADSVAAMIARVLALRGVERVFGLCGGHIMPIWMRLDAEGIPIIDVRDERAAVHMAQAHAELTGSLGVALVTAGPGVTNAITGIANAHVSRAPILVLAGRPPQPQENRGALQDIDHPLLLAAITRYARSVREPELVAAELDEAIARAFGEGAGGEPGPVFLDFPVDTLRSSVPKAAQSAERGRAKERIVTPSPATIEQAVELLWSARRPLVISGRGAHGAGPELAQLLARLNAVYLDTGESRGLVPDDHPAIVASLRGAVMSEADLVVTVGRRLDFRLAYGSPAIFGAAKFLRIAEFASELRDNRRGDVEIHANPAQALTAIIAAARNRVPATDLQWVEGLRVRHKERAAKLRRSMAQAPPGGDGRMHPNRLLSAIQDKIRPDTIVIVDGGDFLSFARVGLSATTMLDPGPLGCIGVGVPYGIAASLAYPDRPVIVATGDGAFGFNAIEIDTAVRHKAGVVIVVANNGAWQIEVYDQLTNYGKVAGTKLQFSDYAAMARAFGMHGERVEKAENLAAALDRAFTHRPALLDVIVTPEAVSSDAKSGLAVVPDLQALTAWDDAERKWRQGS